MNGHQSSSITHKKHKHHNMCLNNSLKIGYGEKNSQPPKTQKLSPDLVLSL